MTARTEVQTITGATLAISATVPSTYDSAGYTGSPQITWTTIGSIENFGNHGGTAQINTFTPVDTGAVQKSKGSKDYGTMSLVLGSIPSDTGQALLDTAFESTAHYSFKLSYPDGAVHYFDALVSKAEWMDGAANDNSRRAVDLAISRKPVVVAAP